MISIDTLNASLARLGATSTPMRVRSREITPEQKAIYACEWGLDKDQDVSLAGTITIGPFKNSQWMLVADGHGEKNNVPNFLRKLNKKSIEICFSSNDPGAMLEQLLAEEYPKGICDSGACVVLARISLLGEVEVWNAGDSGGIIIAKYPNGKIEKILQTTPHDANNKFEIARILKERYSKSFNSISDKNNSLQDLQKAGLACKVLEIDDLMMKTLPQGESGYPRATLSKGYRVNLTSGHSYQPSRAIGHAPRGVTGINWDYYRIRVPLGAKVHVVLASDGLFDIIPDIETLYEWCESGGNAMMIKLAERWCGKWEYEHHWKHSCNSCQERRLSYLEEELAKYPASTQIICELRRELSAAIKSAKTHNIKAIYNKRINELQLYSDYNNTCFQSSLEPDLSYKSVCTIQPGIKPDDLSIALCSWQVSGHVTILKGLTSKLDCPEVINFALSHPTLGNHCAKLYFDGVEYNEHGIQNIIVRFHLANKTTPIWIALHETDKINKSTFIDSWNSVLPDSVHESGFNIYTIHGMSFEDKYPASLGYEHDCISRIPIVVLCIGSDKKVYQEHSIASPTIPFYMVNIDRQSINNKREKPYLIPPINYSDPSEVDWTIDPSGTPSLPCPQTWLMWGKSSIRYSPHLHPNGI